MTSTGYEIQKEAEVENRRRNRRERVSADGTDLEWDMGGRLNYLPSLIQLDADLNLLVSGLPPTRMSEVYTLVSTSAERGENIGLDEFPDEETFRDTLELSDTYIGQDPADGSIKLLLIIEPSNHVRSDNPLYADAYIVVEESVQSQHVYTSAVRLAIQFISDLGYEGVMANTFNTHTASIIALRQEGFVVVGCIPWGGYVAKKGWADSMVLYKDLTIGNIKRTPCTRAAHSQVRTNPTSAGVITSSLPPARKFTPAIQGASDRNDTNFEMTKYTNKSGIKDGRPKLEYLPVYYQTLGGSTVIVNYVGDHEVEEVYQLYKEAVEAGQGYGEDEFDGFEGFKKVFVNKGHAFCTRDPATNKIISTMSVSPTAYCRSTRPPVSDAYLLVDPNYRGKGFGRDMAVITLRLMKDLGYKGVVTDTFLTNRAMYNIMQKIGFSAVAYIPRSAQVKGEGWTDVIIQYKSLENNLACLAKFTQAKM